MTRAEQDIREAIGERGAIPFCEFMGLALFHPVDGYYTRPGATTGREGDFSTSPDVSPAFGRRMAVQAIDAWRRLGEGPWTIVELGPGRGLLAADLVAGLAEFEPRAREALAGVTLVEVGPALAAAQRERVDAALRATGDPCDVRTVRGLHELPRGSVRGFVLGNEFLDAFPVHWLVRRGPQLMERHVTIGAGGGLELADLAPVDPRLAERAQRYGLCAEDGWQAEVCLELEAFAVELAHVLDAGAAVFVDYGHTAVRLADEAHSDGTLVGYWRHQVVLELLERPGLQDLTAHVNWDHLADAAGEAGLVHAGRTTQDRFLLALGLAADLVRADDDEAHEDPAALARRLAARSLILPGGGGGRRFEADCYVKNIEADLAGLGDPFAPLD